MSLWLLTAFYYSDKNNDLEQLVSNSDFKYLFILLFYSFPCFSAIYLATLTNKF